MQEPMMQQPNQWMQGEPESQSSILLAQHTTYFLKYTTLTDQNGNTRLICDEVLDFIEPYNPDYPLGYLKKGQKALAYMNKAQSLAYSVASKLISNLDDDQLTQIKNAQGNKKYDLVSKYAGQDVASNTKFCVDYFNDFSRRKQALITHSRTTGINPQQMREFRNSVESANGDDEIERIVSHEISLEFSHPRGEKPKYFGEVIEQDGSIHLWFGDKKTCLHLAADRATNTIVGAYFDHQETLNGYYHVLKQILANYGIPYSFMTDNRTVFNYMSLNPDKRTSEKDVLTQYGYACKQLGIDLKTSSIAQAKALIERDNGTFQGRLVNELKLNGINSIEAANDYLTNTFVPKFNSKFAMDYKRFESVFEAAPEERIINYTLAVLTPRKIDNGNSIKYKNKYYLPYLDNTLRCFTPRTECLVIKSFTGELLVSIDDDIFELKELARNKRFSESFDKIPITNEKTKYIPPMTHPWKLEYFKKQMKKAHTNHVYA